MIKYAEDFKSWEKAKILLLKCLDNLFVNGAIDITLLEIVTNIKIYQPELFKEYENQILLRMGLFYKNPEIKSFDDYVFKIYWDDILDKHATNFTPVQADIIEQVQKNNVFSFSSPTSTGKSFIFRYLIHFFDKDIVIIVPSRALINEYYQRVIEIVDDIKKVNILTFIDFINTKRSKRNIFIITPERSRDLFINADKLNVQLFLFDEAQLSEDDSVRGMYYDSVVRRVFKYFPNSKYIFAYPFISNPEAQFYKNAINVIEKSSVPYNYKNVGQVFYSFNDAGDFFNFSTDENEAGPPMKIEYDPLEKVLKNSGTALIYCAKAPIINNKITKKFQKYLDYCNEITDYDGLEIIDKVRQYIGAKENTNGDYSSLMVSWMKKGIVFHHGSLPLKVRLLIEEFTQKKFCKICFATTTLEQGINMPFDLVWIDRLNASKELGVKNLIGRAGRSTNEPVFDYGQIVIKNNKRKKLSEIVRKNVSLSNKSHLDESVDSDDDIYKEYKEAIVKGSFSEEFNLTESELERIEKTTSQYVEFILSKLYINNKFTFNEIDSNYDTRKKVIDAFLSIYRKYLNRSLALGEEAVLEATIQILFWRVKGKKFSEIVNYRYSYASQMKIREGVKKLEISNEEKKDIIQNIDAKWLTMYKEIPNKNYNYTLSLTYQKKAIEVDYDSIVLDTYDYIDKLIGFRLGDVYYAAFAKYYANEKNDCYLREYAKSMMNLIKYGTNSEKEIWLLRYGFDFDDIEWLDSLVIKVNEEEIIFDDLEGLEEDKTKIIYKYL